jgi:hypothetical protein
MKPWILLLLPIAASAQELPCNGQDIDPYTDLTISCSPAAPDPNNPYVLETWNENDPTPSGMIYAPADTPQTIVVSEGSKVSGYMATYTLAPEISWSGLPSELTLLAGALALSLSRRVPMRS